MPEAFPVLLLGSPTISRIFLLQTALRSASGNMHFRKLKKISRAGHRHIGKIDLLGNPRYVHGSWRPFSTSFLTRSLVMKSSARVIESYSMPLQRCTVEKIMSRIPFVVVNVHCRQFLEQIRDFLAVSPTISMSMRSSMSSEFSAYSSRASNEGIEAMTGSRIRLLLSRERLRTS